MAEYRITEAVFDDNGLEAVAGLMKAAFPKATKYNAAYLRWQYLGNPCGRPVSFNAFAEDGTLAAHYAAIPVKMVIGGNVEEGLLSLNTATHPAHQGRRLFTTLASKTFESAAEKGYKFVVGVANANSTPGFLKHLGFYLVSPLTFKFGIGDIYKGGVPDGLARVFYDDETLDWRLACPEFSYSARGNTIYGSRPEPLFQTAVAAIPEGKSGKELGLKKPSDLFNLYIGIGANPGKGLYFNIPRFVKRSPFNLIFKDLTQGGLPKMTADGIFFQLLDFDVA